MAYRYRVIGKFLVCVDQSILNAIRTFLLRHDRHQLDSLGISRQFSRKLIKVVARAAISPKNSHLYESKPVFGHIAMRVHRGYKFFDFDRALVTKLFSEDLSNTEAIAEISASKTASEFTAAPRFVAADPDSAWFTEEYIRGTHATDLVSGRSSDYLNYYPDAERCLVQLASSSRPIVVSAEEHISRLAEPLFRERWLRARIDRDQVDEVSSFIETLRKWLMGNLRAAELCLVPTHGDFSLVNAISTRDGLRFIDWEGIGPGTFYSDLYNFMLTERFYGRTSDKFLAEASTLLTRFGDAIVEQIPDLREAAEMDHAVVRRLYYLERTRLMVDREVTPNLIDVVIKSIKIFNNFDEESGELLM